jgi:predicted DNA-binding WGR domain protein
MVNKKVSNGHIIDEYCKYPKAVLIDKDDDVYTCMLNQTNIIANKNKYYTMQLLELQSNQKYVHFIRYGRIGEPGKTVYKMFDKLNYAITSFKKQFRSKTGNKWEEKCVFVKKKDRYSLSDVSYRDEFKNIESENIKLNVKKSKLPKRIIDFIKMISDIDMIKNALIELDIDPKKMPLGKITKNQLKKADDVLDSIKNKILEKGLFMDYCDIIKNVTKQIKQIDTDIINLCSDYYTFIPYNCGRNVPPLINNLKMIKKFKKTVDDLKEIAIGIQIIKNADKNGRVNKNQIDGIYDDINTTIVPLANNSKMWNEINKYVKNTHGPTHSSKLEIVDILEVRQKGKEESYYKYCDNIGNRKLLFHGTPQSCVLSILKNDFYLDPEQLNDPTVVITGKMLGNGIYFADMSTKSFNYTKADKTDDIGCIILSEVAMGRINKKINPDNKLTKSKLIENNYQSVMGLGKWGPKEKSINNGIEIPNGKMEIVNNKTYLRYNEYVVYDVNQILIRYVIICKNVGGYDGY